MGLVSRKTNNILQSYLSCNNGRKLTKPRGYKTFSMLNLTKHEICFMLKIFTTANSVLLNIEEHEKFSANKYENANYYWHFHIFSRENFMLG